MDRYCNRPDMYTEDQKMWSDYDDRNGYYLSGGKFVLEKCDCQTPALRSRQQCHIEDPVSLRIFFPSGHSSNGFAGAVTIFCYYRRAGLLSLLMAALIAFSRLYFFVHYPTDILGGILLGTLDALLAVWLVRHLENWADAQSASNADKSEHVQEK